MLEFLTQCAAEYHFAYGIQPIAEVAARVEAEGERSIWATLTVLEQYGFPRTAVTKRRLEWLAGRLAAKQAFASLQALEGQLASLC